MTNLLGIIFALLIFFRGGSALSSFMNKLFRNLESSSPKARSNSMISLQNLPTWEDLSASVSSTPTATKIRTDDADRISGGGFPHTDAKIRLFGTVDEPRVTLFRDTAAWCPYCQKVWIFLEEKRIPYKVEKINMRAYGDKPPAYLRLVPNGLLPAIILDGKVQTESVDIMLNLDKEFPAPHYPALWPAESSSELNKAKSLMRLERELFGAWCSLVFRPPLGNAARQRFEKCLDEVDKELRVTSSPWFLENLSVVDLQYISHVERMLASVPFWSGFKIRGEGRWPALERWISAFEERPSYMATKSDYYTHVMDIPPQYGPGYSVPGTESIQARVKGEDGSWMLPLPPFSPLDLEPVCPEIDLGEEAARHEAAFNLLRNRDNVAKFALRGVGTPGAKQFGAELADPYATPALEYLDDMHSCLRYVIHALVVGYENVPPLRPSMVQAEDRSQSQILQTSLAYLRDRVGVPRDMSYPAARQLRAHLNWVIDQL